MAMTVEQVVKELERRKAAGDPELANVNIGNQGLAQTQANSQQDKMQQAQALINQLAPPQRQSGIGGAIQGAISGALKTQGIDVGGPTESQNTKLRTALQTALGERGIKALFPDPVDQPDRERIITGIDEQGNPIVKDLPGGAKTVGGSGFIKDSKTNKVFKFNPTTEKLEEVAEVPAGSIVRNVNTVEDVANKSGAAVRGKFEETQKVQNELLEQLKDENGNFPKGTTMSNMGITVPLNPVLTDAQAKAVVGRNILRPRVNEIVESIRGGIFNFRKGEKIGDAERTTRQFGVDSTNAFLTFADPELQALQSKMQSLRRLIPFTDGGKQLTPFEAEQVFALLKTAGKSDEQIVTDLNAAIEIVEAAGGIAISGAQGSDEIFKIMSKDPNAVPQDDDLDSMSLDELRALDASGG